MQPTQLDSNRILETTELLCRRVRERFPDAGLNDVCARLHSIAEQAQVRSREIARPIVWMRILTVTVIVIIVGTFAATLYQAGEFVEAEERLTLAELIQVLEAGLNDIVLIGASFFFLVTLENRLKRLKALKAIHELRSLAHIIDMHQLTKDPERVLSHGPATPSSPKRTMSRFELNRYLDYCSEMLALTGKVAALYVQKLEDSQTVAAVNDIETLTTGLSRKIWQKIMMLNAANGKEL
ncbi:MAG: hypothetical protein ACF8TS_15665 [Maioricimonas sp. JB049]